MRGNRTVWRWFRESRQSELVVILGEDFAALLGLALALIAVLATMLTDNPMWDGLGKLGDRLHLARRGIAGNAADRFQRDGDNSITRLLVGVGVAGHPAIEAPIRRAQARKRRPRGKCGWGEIVSNARDLRGGQLEHAVFDAGPFRLDLGGKGVRAEAIDENFDAGLVDVVAPAMQIVDAQDRLEVAQQVRFGQCIADFFGEIGRAPLAAPDPDRKTQAALAEAL